jgi:hypothetical protein
MSEHSPADFTMIHSNNTSQLSLVVNRDRHNRKHKEESPLPAQNVAFAVNYSLPSVDQFIPHAARMPSDRVQSTADTTSTTTSALDMPTPIPPTATQRTQLVEKDMNRGNRGKRVRVVETDPTPSKRVQPKREKSREKSREKVRVRYDMNHVPMVQRHVKFVQHHRTQANSHHYKNKRALPPRRGSNPSTITAREQESFHDTCHKCKGEELPAPFVADSSVVWIPTKRQEWEDCLSEMTAVCTSAALRRHVAALNSTTKTFFAPLSSDYIRDRIDIDDPLEGYQIRHKTGGWLQGFILWTNFTTWTHYFKWDSLHEMSAIPSSRAADKKTHAVDMDGSLSAELEAQPRSGDPLLSGVVFPTIAEIGLLGGMGCGEYLLRMALDDVKSRGQYKYVALQATDQSRTFYERFGFVRVGAVCRYGSHDIGNAGLQGQTNESDFVGYRHWTYANERNLDNYGGPSYMMALRLPSTDHDDDDAVAACSQCADKVQKQRVIDQLKAVAVEEKPEITQLGATPTPFKKKRSSLTPVSKPLEAALKRTPRSQPTKPGAKRALPMESVAPAAKAPNYTPKAKRRKIATAVVKEEREKLLTPPPFGQALSFAQKQYQSVWLAVPPKKDNSGGRRPPRSRRSNELPSGPSPCKKLNSALKKLM